MNVSMASALLNLDAAAASQPAAGEGGGEGFGVAVKDAEAKHAGGRGSAKDAAGRARKDGDGKVAGTAKGMGTKADEATGDGDADDDAATAGTAAVSTPADLLGRLLGAVLAAPKPPAATADANATAAGEGGDAPADGELEERIVISTVADLAGSPPEDAARPKRIALRVTGMETHFEPRLDGATVVEAAKEAAAEPAAASAREPTVAAPKQGFQEILQRLGGAPSGNDGGGGANGEGGKGGERQESAARHVSAQARVQTEAATAGAVSAAEPQADGASTGQIVNTQIARHIVEAFGGSPGGTDDAPDAARPAAGTQLLRMTAGGSALKTLSIQLEPQDLGRVDVSMRLVDGRLQVELAASVPSTAAALAGDRHGLRKILEHAGFALDDAAISIVSRDLGQASPAAAAGATGDRPAGDGQSSSSGRSFDDSSAGGRQASGGRRERGDEARQGEAPARPPAAAGSVYL